MTVMTQGTVVRVTDQSGYGTESLLWWVAQARVEAEGEAYDRFLEAVDERTAQATA